MPQHPDLPAPIEPPREPKGLAVNDKVQCPNCCRMATVTHRDMGLMFFRCELCESVGAVNNSSQ